MFKRATILLAFMFSLAAAQQKLYISDDLYLVDQIGRYYLISSDKIVNEGYKFIVNHNSHVSLERNNCSWDSIMLDELDKMNPNLLESSVAAMKKAIGNGSRLIEVSIDAATIKVDRHVGYPEPRDVEAEGYKIKVLDKGHCFVTSASFGEFMPAALINPNSVSRVLKDGSLIWAGRGCFDQKLQRIAKEVKEIEADC